MLCTNLQTTVAMSPETPARRRKVSKKRMAALGRMARGATSPAKAKSSAKNGKLGGRPPKFQPGDVAIGGVAAPVAIRGRRVTIVGPGTTRASFDVTFNGTRFTVPSWRLTALK